MDLPSSVRGNEDKLFLASLTEKKPEKSSQKISGASHAEKKSSAAIIVESETEVDPQTSLQRGNDLFKQKDYLGARGSYRAAMLEEILTDFDDHALLLIDIRARANCAQCELSLSNWSSARKSASVALDRIQNLIDIVDTNERDLHQDLLALSRKCMFRRAKALHMQDLDQRRALEEVIQLLSIDPENQEVQKLHKSIQEKLFASQDVSKVGEIKQLPTEISAPELTLLYRDDQGSEHLTSRNESPRILASPGTTESPATPVASQRTLENGSSLSATQPEMNEEAQPRMPAEVSVSPSASIVAPVLHFPAVSSFSISARHVATSTLQFEQAWRSLKVEHRSAYLFLHYGMRFASLRPFMTEGIMSDDLAYNMIASLHQLFEQLTSWNHDSSSLILPHVVWISDTLVDIMNSPRFSLHLSFYSCSQVDSIKSTVEALCRWLEQHASSNAAQQCLISQSKKFALG